MSDRKPGFATRAIHAGQCPEQWGNWQVVAPISTSTTFVQKDLDRDSEFVYSRSGNPTRRVLETCLASLEDAGYGICFASCQGATSAFVHLLSAGDHLIASDDAYGGTNRYFTRYATKMGIEVTLVDTTEIENIQKAFKDNTKAIWIESPTNPLMKVTDIQKVSEIVHNRNPSIILAIDNTFLTPYYQKPLVLGADLTVYSLTKYMNGHSDVIMGAICTNRKDLKEELTFIQKSAGAVPSPFDCYQVTRGLKTLPLRMRQHMKSGLEVAMFLENHPRVLKVLHPGLPSHPQYELSKRQSRGTNGMISFYIEGGLEESKKFLSSLKIFAVAGSLGGPESLAELPSVISHSSVPLEHRLKLGITDTFIRLSIGLEDVDDLKADLAQALEMAYK